MSVTWSIDGIQKSAAQVKRARPGQEIEARLGNGRTLAATIEYSEYDFCHVCYYINGTRAYADSFRELREAIQFVARAIAAIKRAAKEDD